jgi:flagellar hook-basal body complex protein FliE
MPIGPVESGLLPMMQPRALDELSAPGAEGLFNPKPTQGVSFADILGGVVGDANKLGHAARAAALDLAEGRSDDIHGTMIATQESGIQMRLVGSIKGKVVDAFYEIWRMSI